MLQNDNHSQLTGSMLNPLHMMKQKTNNYYDFTAIIQDNLR